MMRVSVPTLEMKAWSAPGAKVSFSSAARSGRRERAASTRSRLLPPEANSTTWANVRKVFAKTLVLSSFGAETMRTWLEGRGCAARSAAKASSACLTSEAGDPVRAAPGRKVTLRHQVSFTGSRKGGVWTEARQAPRAASCSSWFPASPSIVSTAVARSDGSTAAPRIFRAAASTR